VVNIAVGTGLWLIGVGANYVPLAVHALALGRPGALAEELSGLDLRREGHRAGVAQLWIPVPFALAIHEAIVHRHKRS
jgi:hypothetical protein